MLTKFDKVAFELSNRCNYASIHPLCPNDRGEPVFLKTRIITDAIDFLGKNNLKPDIYLNIFNEPMIDPRLYYIAQYVRDHSDCGTVIFTNGWAFNQQLHDELFPFRVRFVVSTYFYSEDERLRKVQGDGIIMVQRIHLSHDFINMYKSNLSYQGPCLFPLVYPMVNHLGQMVLCCRDHKWTEIIADLNVVSFEEAIFSERRKEICESLQRGERNLEVCKGCSLDGWGITHEEMTAWRNSHDIQ